MPLLCYSWGTTPQERSLDFPCNSIIEEVDHIYHRGITIETSPEIIFRWLCQLRAAKYSFGRNSSPDLIPGLDELEIGQDIMDIFELVDFEHNRHLTVRTKKGTREARIYGDVAVSYLIVPESEHRCRLLIKCRIKYPRILGVLMRFILPWGDLIMMRRQLHNFKKLSEQMQKGQAS